MTVGAVKRELVVTVVIVSVADVDTVLSEAMTKVGADVGMEMIVDTKVVVTGDEVDAMEAEVAVDDVVD
jgi:hypothetical protein